MRPNFFLLLLIATIVACSDCFTTSDGIIKKHDFVRTDIEGASTHNRDSTIWNTQESNPTIRNENDTNGCAEERGYSFVAKVKNWMSNITKLKSVEGAQDDLAKLTKAKSLNSKSLNGKLDELKSFERKQVGLNKLKTFDGKKLDLKTLKSQLEVKTDPNKVKALLKDDPDLRSVKHLVGKDPTKVMDGELKSLRSFV
ncbi:unnamed protein product [Phytophthora lilii]|uniref:Unnamed protein product n=1 Tax=Phytophthora lilii TaxID=2077276 RepID=A0A9W6WG22_9STRA|nr:unnamed protein product [Phytophthora lilii]